MARPKLKAEKREISGREVKKLRREGILPANLYGKKVKSLALQFPLKEFQKVYDEVGESGLVDLQIDSETRPVLIHNVQLHSVSDEPLHADLHQVSLTEKTTATIPVELLGEAPAVEQRLGILIQPIAELEVEALPADLPEHLEINISSLNQVDDAVTVADILIDKAKVEIKAEPSEVVVKIAPLAKEEEVAPPAPAEGEAAPTEEAAPVEGEIPVEGEAQPKEKPAPEEKTKE